MEKDKFLQLELFSQDKEHEWVTRNPSRSMLNFIWNYEKSILIVIGFIIALIVSFSLGVEKGKKTSLLKLNAHFDIARNNPSPPETQNLSNAQSRLRKGVRAMQIPTPVIIKENLLPAPLPIKQEDVKEPRTQDYFENYTIQLATYHTKTRAQKEALGLKQRGLTPLVLSKSGYAVLCVGKFSNKKSAQPQVVELRKKYRDCFIRRL